VIPFLVGKVFGLFEVGFTAFFPYIIFPPLQQFLNNSGTQVLLIEFLGFSVQGSIPLTCESDVLASFPL